VLSGRGPHNVPTIPHRFLVVRASNIEGAGEGLFASQDLSKGACIFSRFLGPSPETTPLPSAWPGYLSVRIGDNSYCPVKRSGEPSLIGKANHGTPNAAFRVCGGRPCLRLLERLEPGDEILVDYGYRYWGFQTKDEYLETIKEYCDAMNITMNTPMDELAGAARVWKQQQQGDVWYTAIAVPPVGDNAMCVPPASDPTDAALLQDSVPAMVVASAGISNVLVSLL